MALVPIITGASIINPVIIRNIDITNIVRDILNMVSFLSICLILALTLSVS